MLQALFTVPNSLFKRPVNPAHHCQSMKKIAKAKVQSSKYKSLPASYRSPCQVSTCVT